MVHREALVLPVVQKTVALAVEETATLIETVALAHLAKEMQEEQVKRVALITPELAAVEALPLVVHQQIQALLLALVVQVTHGSMAPHIPVVEAVEAGLVLVHLVELVAEVRVEYPASLAGMQMQTLAVAVVVELV